MADSKETRDLARPADEPQPGRRRPRRGLAVLLLAALAIALLGSGRAGPAPLGGARPAAELDASAAGDFLAFCRAAGEGRPWSEDSIRRMVATPPYRVLIAHHNALDATFTPEALLAMLVALGDGRPFSPELGRLMRTYVTYRQGCDQVEALQARLETLCDPALVERAYERARANLPPQARPEAKVYLVADGFSAAYVAGDAIVLDLLQISQPWQVEAWLAHELHHIGAESLLPVPCPEPALGTALDILAGVVQEGAATCWIDRWRAAPTAADYDLLAAFLRDTLLQRLPPEQLENRIDELLHDGRDGRGPLYRVGNRMIAGLAASRGDAWVRARLGDPVALLRAWQEVDGSPSYEEVLALLDEERALCPAWFARRR